MSPAQNDTPPHSPGIPASREEDEGVLFEDDVLEEIEVGEGEADGDDDGEMSEDDDELVELPGGIDQLESILEQREQTVDDSCTKFLQHNKSVFCCSYHPAPDCDLIASGGEDDMAYIWNSVSGEVVHKVSGWKDSVHCGAWSADGHHLALADMSGAIKVLRYPGFAEVWSFDVGDILWLQWHSVANVLFCGTADSEMWMWRIPSGDSKLFQGQGEKTECGSLLADGKRAVCGYSDGSLRIFDLKTVSAIHTISPKGFGHLDSVNCVDCHPNNNLIVSGSMDGTAKLWNPNSGKCVGTLLSASKQEENSSGSVECAIFPQDKSASLCITGSLEGVVSVWDTPTQISRFSCKVGEGVTKLLVHPTDPVIVAGNLDGSIRCLDLRSGDSVNEFSGHNASILDITISPSGHRIVSSSDDGSCRVFDFRK